MKPIVSIIIPVYNRANLIVETLDSILAQTYNDWECIIVDDGSIDNTIEVVDNYVQKDFRFKFFKRPNTKPKGPSSCRNYAIDKALGNYVVFLDSDDLLASKCLENRMLFVKENPNKDFWIFMMATFKDNIKEAVLLNTIPTLFVKEEEFYISEFLKGKVPIAVTCALWKMNLLKILNGFDENLTMLEDPDLHVRAFKSGINTKTAINYDFDCFYRINAKTEERNNCKVLENNFYFFKKHIDQTDNNIKINFKRIYNLYIFPNKSFKYNFKMSFLGIKYGLIGVRYFLYPIIILVYNRLGFNNIKGLGYITLRKKFNKF